MAEPCFAVDSTRLTQLLKELGAREFTCQSSFTAADASTFLTTHPRNAWNTVQQGIVAGVLSTLPNEQKYALTQLGYEQSRNARQLTHALHDVANQCVNGPVVRRRPVQAIQNSVFANSLPTPAISNKTATLPPLSETLNGARHRACEDRQKYFPEGNTDWRASLKLKNMILDPDLTLKSDLNLRSDPERARSKGYANQSFQKASVEDLIRSTRAGNVRNVRLADSGERARVYAMSCTYTAHVRQYRTDTWQTPSVLQISPGTSQYTCFLKAADLADRLQVTYEVFVKAQFFWFDRWFLRTPKIWELLNSEQGKFSAEERVRRYLEEISAGAVDERKAVVGPVRGSPKVSAETKALYCEKSLKRLMQVHNATEEQILLAFAKGENAQFYFDLHWLKQNPTYLQLKASGAL